MAISIALAAMGRTPRTSGRAKDGAPVSLSFVAVKTGVKGGNNEGKTIENQQNNIIQYIHVYCVSDEI